MDAPAISQPSVEQLKPYQWQKGTSGNPSGRPKLLPEFREECREHTGTALQTLLAVMANPKAMSSSKIQAAKVLLAYAWGAPSTEDTERANNQLVINVLKLVGGETTAVVKRLTNGAGHD